METIPQFLCFRFKGLKRPDELIATSEKTGWSFRKWQNWKQIYIEPSDKSLLKKCGDALVDHAKFSMSDFGRISEIMVKVARWRKDREDLSIPPDPLPAWSELDELLRVFVAAPAAVAVKIQRDHGGLTDVSEDCRLDVFYWLLLMEFFQKLQSPCLKAISKANLTDLKRLEQAITESIRELYISVGLRVPAFSSDTRSRKLVSKCYKDLGFSEPNYDLKVPWETARTSSAISQPLVCFDPLGPVELLRISYRESALLLCINKDHALVKELDRLSSKRVLELLLAAYAEAVASLPNKQDDFEQFSTLLALKAKRLIVNGS